MWKRAMRITTSLAAGMLIAACSTTTVSPSPPVEATGGPIALGQPKLVRAELHEVVVALMLDHERAPSGQELRARVEVTNTGSGPVSWQSGGCGLFNGLSLSGPDVPQPPPGRAWDGTAHWAKWSATTSGVGLVPFVPPNVAAQGQPWSFACSADLRVEDLAPGELAVVDAVWVGFASDGQPTPGGRYTLSYAFPFLARVPKEAFRGDPIADATPIKVALDFMIDARPGVAVPSTLAFDAALADARVANWISRVTREQLYGASVVLEGGVWHIRIETESGAAEIGVIASTGTVASVKVP